MKIYMQLIAALLAISASAGDCLVCNKSLEDNWVECNATAESRDQAILRALKEGVSQVYGLVLNGKVQVSSASANATSNVNGTKSSASSSSDAFSEELAAETAGMVKKWTMISEKEADGEVSVHIHAKVINPRKDNVRTVMLLPVKVDASLKNSNIKMENGRHASGAEIGNLVGETLRSCLSGQSTFEIRTPGDLSQALDMTKLDRLLVKGGAIPASELQEMGQMLTTDFLLTVVLKELKYTHKMGFKGGKIAPNDRFVVTLNVTLTNVKNGSVASSSTVTAELRNKDIVKLRAKDENVKLLDAALSLLYFPLTQWTADVTAN